MSHGGSAPDLVLTQGSDSAEGARTYRKVVLRIGLFLFACYVLNFLDRINLSFAALQMRSDLGFNDAVYGFGVSMFYVTNIAFGIPAMALTQRIGPHRSIPTFMVLWSIASGAVMFIGTPAEFYALRLLLGVAEAGFLPGVILYLTRWSPARLRARMTTLFFAATAATGIIGAPISGWIMSALNGVGGLRGWQWVFVLEAVPSIVLGLIAFTYLKPGPDQAPWLDGKDRAIIKRDLAADRAAQGAPARAAGSLLGAFADYRVYVAGLAYFGTSASFNTIVYWLPIMIRDLGARSPFYIGLLAVLPYCAMLAGMVLVSWHSDLKLERRWHFAVTGIVGVAALSLSTCITSIPLFLLVMMIAAGGVQGTAPILWTIPATYLRGASAAVGIAIVNCMGQAGSLLSPSIIGTIRTSTGSLATGIYGISLIMVVTAVILLVGTPRTLAAVQPILKPEHAT